MRSNKSFQIRSHPGRGLEELISGIPKYFPDKQADARPAGQ